MTISPAAITIATSQDRRREVRAHHHNGLDLVEVHENRRELSLMFLEQTPHRVQPGNIRVDGPATQLSLSVTSVRRLSSSDPRLRDELIAELSAPGGAGVYRVSMVEARPDGQPGTVPLTSLDPQFTSCTIRFDIDQPAPSPLVAQLSPPPVPTPAATYLARDYEALRQLLLAGLAQDLSGWSEQHIPDLMVMLVELFAFLGDDLSYYQDAVATEAYLETARQRTSIRRHARLVGYPFHEGCHARAWICVEVNADCDLTLQNVSFLAETTPETVAFSPLHATLPPPYGSGETTAGQPRGGVVPLRVAHNEIDIWHWGESDCYLPLGATEATLAEPVGKGASGLQLQPGDLLMFEEQVGADGGPADETHRHTVRLTRVERGTDPLLDRAIVEVAWDALDALPFALPVTTTANEPARTPCSVAHANLLLAGAGRVVANEQLDSLATTLTQPDMTWSCPYPDLNGVALHQSIRLRDLYHTWRAQITRWRRRAQRGEPLTEAQHAELARQFDDDLLDELGLDAKATASSDLRAEADALGLWILLVRADDLLESRIRRLRVLSRLAVASGPLSGPLLAEVRHDWGDGVTAGLDPHHPGAWGSAAQATTQDPTAAQPLLQLVDAQPIDGEPTAWEVTTGLVDVEPEARRVVVEMQDDRTAALRFNPATEPHGTLTAATYHVGNGSAGNVAAETITLIAGGPSAVVSVRNPLPATGGRDPETLDDAKRAIPGCYLDNQQRALAPEDYVAITRTVPGVRNAAASLDWSGNRLRMRVAVQPAVGEDPGRVLLHRVEHTLIVARRIGHDLVVTPPDYCPIAITLTVELDTYAIRDTVREQIAELLGSGTLADGTPAFFSPTRFSFGDALYQSALVAAVQEVDGVVSVPVASAQLLTPIRGTAAASDSISVSPTDIIRCDNDPSAMEHGSAELTLVGGR
jgi:predicted phage baseplate assembly protein